MSDREIDEISVENGKEKNDRDGFPNVFYCPITKQVMDDPVVVFDGESYERSALEKRGDVPSSSMYPNRALATVIEEAKERHKTSMISSVRSLQRSMRDSFRDLLNRSALPFGGEYRPLLDVFYCPITLELMHRPVIDKDGTTYDRRAIVNWIRTNGTSPTTREEASVEDLYANNTIEALIESELGRSEDSMHPSVRRWRDEQSFRSGGDDSLELGVNNDNTNDENNATERSSLPVTHDQIAELERRRRHTSCSVFSLFLGVVVLISAGPYSLFFLVFMFVAVIVRCHNECDDEDEDE